MIDAHFRIWRLSRGDYGWLTPALGAIHRDVTFDDWREQRASRGVDAGILVQAAPTEAETAFRLQQASGADDVPAVVGWVDMLAPDAPARIGALAARHPELRIVIDHGAKPDIAHRQWQDWARDLVQLARYPQVACKLSGLWAEAAAGAPEASLALYGAHLIECFGPARVLWGSDWLVLERAADYARWHRAACDMVALPQRREIFGATARRVYRI